jgi:hypothetical protein
LSRGSSWIALSDRIDRFLIFKALPALVFPVGDFAFKTDFLEEDLSGGFRLAIFFTGRPILVDFPPLNLFRADAFTINIP